MPYWKHETEESTKVTDDTSKLEESGNEEQLNESTESTNQIMDQGIESPYQGTDLMNQGVDTIMDQEPPSINEVAGSGSETVSCMDPRKVL